MNSPCNPSTGKVEYRPVSHHQTCVWCVNDATQEAVQKKGTLTAISRCCDDPKCMWLSAENCERTVVYGY
jgi:hypothetical protein